MDSVLGKIQCIVNKYAVVLSEVLKVDVEIVDINLNRIAGTGSFGTRINVDMSREGYVYRDVIKTKERRVITEPGSHKICMLCPKRNNCEETFEISTPIMLDDDVVGVIGFVCFDEVQKKHIMDNLESLLNFLEQISELISLKAKEEIENEKMYLVLDLLNGFIDRIEDGVIIVDENDSVIKINKYGKNILKKYTDEVISKVLIKDTGNIIFDRNEYEVLVNSKKINIIGEMFELNKHHDKSKKVLIFDDIEKTREVIFSITNSKRDIGIDEIIGLSEKIISLKDKIKRISKNNSTILISGESGTGKELCARAIHMNSKRAEKPFVAINCSAIPEALLESELFGYASGAFTGANKKGKIGKFEFANSGTIFLDEIGDLPLYMQAKLLRVIQERSINKIGSNNTIDIDVRIIAATNRNLEEMMLENTFREDLYYRINVIPIRMPPLRERKEDLIILTNYFVNKYCELLGINKVEMDKNVYNFFYGYDWPGNVRELENTIEFMINMADENAVIDKTMMPKKLRNIESSKLKSIFKVEKEFNLKSMEKRIISEALDHYGDTTEGKKIAAKELGIGIATLYRKIEKDKLSI
jgi:transcriptional regulator with PAS, ATPase and Fis domain